MCGICGIVAPGRPPESETVRAMADALAHRGPNGDGFFSAPGVAPDACPRIWVVRYMYRLPASNSYVCRSRRSAAESGAP